MHRVIYLIVDRVRSLHNVGSLFRTADALGVAKIYLCGYTGAPPRPEIAKVALGAEKSVPWEKRAQTWKLVEELQAQGVQVVALEIDPQCRVGACPRPRRGTRPRPTRATTSICKWKPKFPVALVVGNEVNGVSGGVLARCDAVVHIPMLGAKESLNVSVAAGIALYAVRYNKV